MSKYILLIALLAMACTKGISQITTTDFSENSLPANTTFARFDHSDEKYDYFYIQLRYFHTDFERYYFYNQCASKKIFMFTKKSLFKVLYTTTKIIDGIMITFAILLLIGTLGYIGKIFFDVIGVFIEALR